MNLDHKKIVFDTSALIPICLHPDRAPAQIFKLAVLQHPIFSSQECLDELNQVLMRSKFDAWQPLSLRMAWNNLYQSLVTIIAPSTTVLDCRDKQDNKFLEVAITIKADYLISSDIHQREMHPSQNTSIIRLQDFANILIGIK